MLWWLGSGMCQWNGICSSQLHNELQQFRVFYELLCINTPSNWVNLRRFGLIQSQYAEPIKLGDASLWVIDCLVELLNGCQHAAIQCMYMVQAQLVKYMFPYCNHPYFGMHATAMRMLQCAGSDACFSSALLQCSIHAVLASTVAVHWLWSTVEI
jgi:hypothetical protein